MKNPFRYKAWQVECVILSGFIVGISSWEGAVYAHWLAHVVVWMLIPGFWFTIGNLFGNHKKEVSENVI